MAEPSVALLRLADRMGVAARFRDGLGQDVRASPETLVRVCAALGAPVERAADAGDAIEALAAASAAELVPPVLVAWDGSLGSVAVDGASDAVLTLDDGTTVATVPTRQGIGLEQPLPPGYHRLQLEVGGRDAAATVISAPERSWHRAPRRRWGVSAHLAALRSSRSRAVGDLTDLAALGNWIGGLGGDVVSVLPLLPTFNDPPTEPSPYSPVSRLFWSELVLDLDAAHHRAPAGPRLQVDQAAAEVRAGLAGKPAPDPATVDAELARYARFRAAQCKLGRDWRAWPGPAREGLLSESDVDADEERFHLLAQLEVRPQLEGLCRGLERSGVTLGLDLAVGVHPEGYDAWSRPDLFASGIAVGAPPDAGFPSGQSWGFPPVVPHRSRLDGHRYIAASVAHQAAAAGLLRVDHIMAMSRLYWIPEGMDLAEGTYVRYPTEELFAVLSLESHRNRCELVGENLGTVPPDIDEALPRHRIWGMYLAEFEAASGPPITPPADTEAALVDTHDTPTLAGWLAGGDIDERVRVGLLARDDAPTARAARRAAVRALARELDTSPSDPETLLAKVVTWLGASTSPLVVLWLEDLWLESEPVNVPGSSSGARPNWQRPMRRLLDEIIADPDIADLLQQLDTARRERSQPDPEQLDTARRERSQPDPEQLDTARRERRKGT